MNYRIKFRRTTNGMDTGINTTQELFSQSHTALLIPSIRFADVMLYFWSNNQLSGHSGCEPFA